MGLFSISEKYEIHYCPHIDHPLKLFLVSILNKMRYLHWFLVAWPQESFDFLLKILFLPSQNSAERTVGRISFIRTQWSLRPGKQETPRTRWDCLFFKTRKFWGFLNLFSLFTLQFVISTEFLRYKLRWLLSVNFSDSCFTNEMVYNCSVITEQNFSP